MVTVRALSGGDAGVAQTIDEMRRLVRSAAQYPEVKALAVRIVSGISPDNPAAMAEAIKFYTQERFDFIADTVGTEELTAPHILVQRINLTDRTYGDCDDLSILQAALLHAIGIPAHFITTGVGPLAARSNSFNHVYAAAKLGDQEYCMDFLPVGKLSAFRRHDWGVAI